MKPLARWLGLTLAFLALASAAVSPADGQEPAPALECVPDQLLVKFRPGADPLGVVARHDATIESVLPAIDVYVVGIPSGTVLEKMAEFQLDPDVEFAEPNAIVRIPESPAPRSDACGTP